MREGRFREDLFFRLNVIQIEIPPLRERPEDVVRLAEKLLAFYGRNNHRAFAGFTEEALKGLKQYPWPGNVRELSNVIERTAILCQADRVGVECLPQNLNPHESLPKIGDPLTLEKIEELHIRQSPGHHPITARNGRHPGYRSGHPLAPPQKVRDLRKRGPLFFNNVFFETGDKGEDFVFLFLRDIEFVQSSHQMIG